MVAFIFNTGSSDPAWSLNAVYQFLSYLGENPEHKFSRNETFLVTKPCRLHFFMHPRLCACLNDHLLNFIWFMVNVKAIISTTVIFVLK